MYIEGVNSLPQFAFSRGSIKKNILKLSNSTCLSVQSTHKEFLMSNTEARNKLEVSLVSGA